MRMVLKQMPLDLKQLLSRWRTNAVLRIADALLLVEPGLCIAGLEQFEVGVFGTRRGGVPRRVAFR